MFRTGLPMYSRGSALAAAASPAKLAATDRMLNRRGICFLPEVEPDITRLDNPGLGRSRPGSPMSKWFLKPAHRPKPQPQQAREQQTGPEQGQPVRLSDGNLKRCGHSG